MDFYLLHLYNKNPSPLPKEKNLQKTCLDCKKFMDGLSSQALILDYFDMQVPFTCLWHSQVCSILFLLWDPDQSYLHRMPCVFTSPPLVWRSVILPPIMHLTTQQEKHLLTFYVSCGFCVRLSKFVWCVNELQACNMVMAESSLGTPYWCWLWSWVFTPCGCGQYCQHFGGNAASIFRVPNHC
jgi:hypothetical protein